MIQLAGSAERSFQFPGSIHQAIQHYADMRIIFRNLPHIELIEKYSANQFRVLYSSTELSIYKIKLYCDLEVSIDIDRRVIIVGSLNGKQPVKPKAGLHSSRGNANFTSSSKFIEDGKNTQIYYHLNLEGALPTPRAFSLIPDRITNHIAENITSRRIFEIADGFIDGSLADFNNRKAFR